jgi:hypothetical protein
MERARRINGDGAFHFDLAGRVYGQRLTLDRLQEVEDDALPAVWLWRAPDGEQREQLSNESLTRVTTRWTALMVVPEGEDPGAEVEHALADLLRAFEIDTDRFLVADDQALLGAELSVDTSTFSLDSEVAGVQCAAVDIVTAHIHHYGDPAKL